MGIIVQCDLLSTGGLFLSNYENRKGAGLTFVHLSDIHFGQEPPGEQRLHSDIRNQLVVDCEKLAGELGKPFGVLVTGDISYSAEPSQFAASRDWLITELGRKLGSPAVFTVPGNHDVEAAKVSDGETNLRELIRSVELKAAESKFGEYTETYDPSKYSTNLLAKFANYNDFAGEFNCSINSHSQPWWEHRGLQIGNELNLDIFGLNSCLISFKDDHKFEKRENPFLILGSQRIIRQPDDSTINLVLMHHPFDCLIDNEAAQKYLRSRARVILTGHRHSSKFRQEDNCIIGQAGATNPPNEEPPAPYSYSWLRISQSKENEVLVELWPRIFVALETQTAFKADHQHYNLDEEKCEWYIKVSKKKELRPSIPKTIERLEYLPYKNRRFFMPELVQELRQRLISGSGLQWLYGLGGVGKSQAALEYAYEFKNSYDIIWWIPAARESIEENTVVPLQLSVSCSRLSDALDLAPDITEEHVKMAKLADWLSRTNQKYLVIFDGVDKPADIVDFNNHMQMRLVPPSIPVGSHIVITSRSPRWPETDCRFRVKTWSPSTHKDLAERYLIERTGQVDQLGAAARLAEMVGYLPLALEQACSYIGNSEESRCTIDEYCNLFERHQELILERGEVFGYNATVATAWDLSLEQVQCFPATALLIQILSWLAPDQIPIAMFETWRNNVPNEMIETSENSVVLNDAIDLLLNRSLVEREKKHLFIHKIVQRVIRLKQNRENAKRYAEFAFFAVNDAFQFDEHDVLSWQSCDVLTAHAVSVLHHLEAFDCGLLERDLLLTKMAQLQQKRANYEQAEIWIKEALKLQEKFTNSNDLNSAYTKTSYGELLIELGRLDEAEKLVIEALDIRKNLLPSDSFEVARSENALAVIYLSRARFSDAEKLLKEVYAKMVAALGADSPYSVTIANSLASLYSDLGRFDEAEPLYQETLKIRSRVLGPEHPDTAFSIGSIALLRLEQAKYDEGFELLKLALEVTESQLGASHPRTAAILNNIARFHQLKGEYTKAESLYDRALLIRTNTLGPNHSSTAGSMNNLAGLYQEQGRHKEAEQMYEQAIAVCQKGLGPLHTSMATLKNNIARLYKTTGRYREAEPLYIEALRSNERDFGPAHQSVAATLINLASLYMAQDMIEKGKPLYRRAIDILKGIYGSCHPALATALNNLGSMYESEGKIDLAEALYLIAFEIQKASLGLHSISAATSYNNIGGILRERKEFEKSEWYYKEAIKIATSLMGAENPSAVSSQNNLAGLYALTGRVDKAVRLYQQTMDMSIKLLGPSHPETLITVANLAALNQTLGKLDEAEALWQTVLHVKQANGHFSIERVTANSLQGMARIYHVQRKHLRAENFYEAAIQVFSKLRGPNHKETVLAVSDYVHFLADQKYYAKAVHVLERRISECYSAFGADSIQVANACIELADMLKASRGSGAYIAQLKKRAEKIFEKRRPDSDKSPPIE